ncbi:lysine N(6)-hydroxylase/L-ornithine N(5)-oxygenase family protein [Actinomadura rupiterrae]|uniref:lysine N(6)-hydroxylase/L-ornithine N(5)-oxygenase family protein n=1 Tax=Actinomadura rupiterrae TaxID=559627 RepID=UPI0020A37877|nr:SidA/IucD/PvdA family monooxygenase [Actinomadura rupiterrae]MCP2339294.1 L-ornithine N5-oxygenase [Actinomadura rupiterrae]
MDESELYDVVGIGFGPSNLSLAIALEESEEPLSALFLERQPALGWHRGMLVPSAKMQVSFLKDLVTFRNPVSPFSFVSYLHERGRLVRFVNNQDFFPTRREFHDYLEWAAARVAHRVDYGAEVTAVRAVPDRRPGPVDRLRVEVRDPRAPGGTRSVDARNLVISTGLVPRMPAGMEPDESVFHAAEFLHRFRRLDPRSLRRVAVAGAGQSAAEVVKFLYDALPEATVYAILPSYGYTVADDTPFANQVFDPAAVDDYYHGSAEARTAFWRYHAGTNYSVVDGDVAKELYRRAYDDELSGTGRLRFLNLSRVTHAKSVAGETRVTVHSTASDRSRDLDVDLLVCATGYDPMDPGRVLGELAGRCARDAAGRLRVERDYRVVTGDDVRCGIYLQGGTEDTHGLSSSLLSNLATRSGEIVGSIAARAAAEKRNGVRV